MRTSSPDEPGIRRWRRGTGFRYVDADGRAVSSGDRARIESLAIPPAWRNVWICCDANAHLLATGVDAAGRTQYLYHPTWRKQRDAEKFERVLELVPRLPRMRRTVSADLSSQGLGRDRVLALVLRLLDTGRLRAGATAYEEENGSHGAVTLLGQHVRVHRTSVELRFPAKGGDVAELELHDPVVVRALSALRRACRRDEHVMRWRSSDGWHDLTGDAVSSRFKELTDDRFTVKDLRTLAATVTAAVSLADSARRGADRGEQTALEDAADSLGDTVEVARTSYVDPRLLDAYRDGRTVRPIRGTDPNRSERIRRRIELELVHLLRDG